ncbi:MAG: hypothetical protein QOJ19_4160 [Acidimicrobiia bacterium]|jgi:hypothetical protein|nr:hypothetical protein [Acidimicrobiia bacterium]
MLFADLGMPSYETSDADLAAITIPGLILTGTHSHPSLHTAAATWLAGYPPPATSNSTAAT